MANNKKRKKKLNIFRLTILIFLLIITVLAGVACSYVYNSVSDMPEFNPENVNFAVSTEIYDINDNLITRVGIQNRILVSISQVPDVVKNAFLAVEDHRFYEHRGVDIYRIFGAAWANIKAERIHQGGSTITQQLVRHTTDIGIERTLKRKIQEAILAIQMERYFSKHEILEHYLNGIYLGAGAHGIQAAAHTYFNKDVSELTLSEAALLAGLPQAPSAYNPFRNPEAAKERRNIVLSQMANHGYITQAEAEAAKAEEIALNPGKITGKEYPYPYFIDHVIELLVDKYGEVEVFRGGLKVYTTLDPKIQKAAEEVLKNNNNFPNSTRDENNMLQPNAAAIVLDPYNGYVKAIVGGREHKTRRGWNRATEEKRRPGSAFKPIISYGPAIEYLGKAPASVYDDRPVKFGKYAPKNYDGRFRGLIIMRYALQKSVNIPAVLALKEVGMPKALEFVSKLGLENDRKQIEMAGLAAALGGLDKGVTPLQMAAAFAAFANEGIYTQPIVIRKVEKLNGVVLENNLPKQHRAMKATTAYLITDMLKSVVTSGTGTAARMNRPVAGKTGTADNEHGRTSDTWFVGYTADLVCAVWIGNKDQNKALPRGYFGGTYTARIWKQIMTKAHEGLPVRSFAKPPGIVVAAVDKKSGLLPGPLTPPEDIITDIFAQGTVPTKTDDTRVMIEVCNQSNKLPSEFCWDREYKMFIKLPYEVDERVADYSLRAPVEICDVCKESEMLPDFLESLEEGIPDWIPIDPSQSNSSESSSTESEELGSRTE